jgi:hypothetical protein
MRLRCPNQGCSIEVPDDMIGTRIRCPHCDQFLLADLRYREEDSQRYQHLSLDPPSKSGHGEPAQLEHGLREGLPPLALMLAVRAGKGASWTEPRGLRKEMTDLDWKALAAFEQIVLGSISLTRSLGLGTAASVFTVLITAGAELAQDASPGAPPVSGWLWRSIGSLVLLGAGLFFMLLGAHQLPRLRIGVITTLAAWSALAVALVLSANALSNLLLFFRHGYAKGFCLALLAIPLPLIAAAAALRASLRVQRSVDEVSRQAILSRLTEAMKFLD